MSSKPHCFHLGALIKTLFFIIPIVFADLPINTPTQIVSSCSTDADCPNYKQSRCSGGSCTGCNSNSQCNHIYSPGDCNSILGYCNIPCDSSNTDICTSVRTRCQTVFGINSCLECLVNSDCGDLPGSSWCKLSLDVNLCVNCRSNSDCSSGTCQNYKCVACNSDTDCTDTTKPYCYQTFQSNTCTECFNSNNTQCTAANKPKCSDTSCVGCTSNTDCSHIPGKPVCSTGTGTCVECTASSQCNSDSTKSVCNTALNVCQMCTNDFECPTNFPLVPVCASGVGCVQCTNSTSCTNPLLSSCNSGYTCELCTASSSCSQFSTTKVCSGSALGCVECMSTSDCTDPTKSVCDTGTHTCVPCTDGTGQCSHLSNTPYCTGSQCVECLTSNNCLTVAKPVCGATNACEACTIDGQCSRFSSAPFCSTPLSRCTECLTSTTCLSPLKSNCDTGSCQLCTDNTQCQHLTATPFCIYSGCVGCVTNNDCPSTSLAYCSPTLHQCQACTVDSQCTHIPSKNKCWYGECLEYLGACTPSYVIEIVQQNKPNIFYITFPQDLVLQIDILHNVRLSFDNVSRGDYDYNLIKLTDTLFEADFTVEKTIPPTELLLEIPCPTPAGQLYANITQQIETKRIPYSTEEIITTVETLKTITDTLSASVTVATAIMVFIGSNPAILWALIGLFQTFYYMLFINVQYPANVEAFFPIFTLGNLNFIPNPMNIIFPDIDDYSLPVPQKFADYDVDGLFLSNAGDMLLLWFLNLAVYGLCFLLLKYARNMPRLLIFICMKSVDVFEWSGTIRTFITSFMEISVASFLQLRVLVFDSGLFATSSVCGIVFGVFSVLLPVATFKIVEKYDTKPKLITKKFGTLIEDYRLNDGIQKYFTVINIGRNLIMAATLVYLHNYPYIEIITLISTSFSFAYLIWKHRPYESKTKNMANFISEFVFGIVYTFIFILIHDDYSPSFSDNSRLNVGWGIICGCAIILMTTLVVSLYEQLGTMKETIGLLRNFLKKNSKTPEARMKNLQIKITRAKTIFENRLDTEENLNKSTDLSNASSFLPSTPIITSRPSPDTQNFGEMPRLNLNLHDAINKKIDTIPENDSYKLQRPSRRNKASIYPEVETQSRYFQELKKTIPEVANKGTIETSPLRGMRHARTNRPFHLPITK